MQLPGKAFGPANACGQCARPTRLAFLACFGCFFRPKRKHWGCRMSWKSQKRYPKSFPLYYGSAFAISLCYFMPQKGCNLLNSKLLWFGRKNNQPTLQTQNKYHPPPKKVPSPLFHANYPPWKQQVRTWKWIHFSILVSFLGRFGLFSRANLSVSRRVDSRASPAAHPPVSIPRNTAAATSRRSPKLASNKGNAKPKDKVSTWRSKMAWHRFFTWHRFGVFSFFWRGFSPHPTISLICFFLVGSPW